MPDAIARGIAEPPAQRRLGDWLVSELRSDCPFVLSDATPLSKVLVREGRPGSLDELLATGVGRAGWTDDRLITCVAPGEWLVIGPPAARHATLPNGWKDLINVAEGLVLDVTHARAALRLRGVATAKLFARMCAIDLAARAPLSSLRTHVAGVVADVVILEEAAASLLIHIDRSYGAYLLRTVIERCTDLGIDLAGLESWPPRSIEPIDG